MKTRTLLRRKQVLNRAWSVGGNPACEVLENRMLLAAPIVSLISPYDGGLGVGVSAKVSVAFDQAMNRATITNSTFQLLDSANNPIPGRISYNSVNKTATFDANTPLDYSRTYHAVVVGGTSGVKNSSNQALAANVQWTFTTAAAPTQGQGGPILVVTNSANPFSSYYAEILRAEGLNSFATSDISTLSASSLSSYGVVILGQTTLTDGQATILTDWVTNGGNLIAMRPDKKLASLLGLTDAGATQPEGYLLVNTASGPGVGITGETMQFHGTADRYTLNGATSIATLYSSASTATANPAVTVRSVGTQGGQAAAFTFDLARSIVYTRQGNPAWSGMERDNADASGANVIRPDDLFYGGAQPNWVDLNKVSIPQADEEQRLLANMITQMDLDKMPLPRFWYLPNGAKAALIMTGDDHAAGGAQARFDNYLTLSPTGSSVSNWTAIRGTSYMYASTSAVSDSEAAYYTANGFEMALHVNNGPRDFADYGDLEQYYDSQLTSFNDLYPSIPTPVTHRMHAIVWSDYATQPQVEFAHRIRLDTSYYYYPDFWVQNRPGFFTGSGMPMRFATSAGQTLDVYQVTTEMTDESGQTYPFTTNALLDKALGSQGYYGMFCANIHTDDTPAPGESDVIDSARAHNVPIISSKQALDWVDGRNGSSFSNLTWDRLAGTLSFGITAAVGADGMQAMLPLHSANGTLNAIKRNGTTLPFTTQTIKGVDYAFFSAAGGNYSATYTTPAETFSIWPDSAAPVTPSVNDTGKIEVGVKFRADVDGYITGIRFYKGSLNTGTHIGDLWDRNGNKLASAVSVSETATGWQTVNFDQAVPITANTTYIASYFTSSGYYSADSGYFSSSGVTNGHLRALANGEDGPNGVYQYGASSIFPDQSFGAANYWVDVLFTTSSTDTQPPTVTAQTPTPNATNIPIGATVTVRFSEAVDPATITTTAFQLKNGSTTVPANVAYDAATHIATLTATAALLNSTTYTASISGVKDLAGNTMTGTASWQFTTASAGPGGYTIWSESATPTLLGLNDAVAYELGVKFRANVAGSITGIRFYKGATDSGTYLGNLWDSAGNRLATATFATTTTTGWQTVYFNSPVAIAANTTYIASYHTNAYYVADTTGPLSFVSSGVTSDPLYALRNGEEGPNGIYASSAASVFPNQATNGFNYWVDVVFVSGTDTTPPTVTAQTPLPNATNVPIATTVSVTFSEDMDATTITPTTFQLKNGATVVLADVVYNNRIATLTPRSPLVGSTTYTATITGVKDLAGNALAAALSWSFTTAAVDTTPPTVTGRTPADAATNVPVTTTVTVTFSEAVDATTINATNFQLKNGSTIVPATVAYNATTHIATLTPTAALAGSTSYTATVSGVKDLAGNTLTGTVSWSFTTAVVDTTPPTVTGQTPAPNATNVPANTTVTVTFSEAVDAATITLTSFQLKNGATVVPATVAYNPTTHIATLTPSSALASLTQYTASISGVKDLAGNALAAPVSWSFTTADTQAPTITAQTPAANATNVPVNTTVTVTFSEDMDATTITTSSFQLKNGSTVVPALVNFNHSTRVATLTPTANLAGSTTYTATIAGAKDLAGNTLAAALNWSFTTAAVDTTPPTVTGRTPADAATDVPVTTTVTVTFSEAMDVATINPTNFQLKNGATVVPATVAYNATTRTATLTPSNPLAASTAYTATIAGVKDLAGNALTSAVTWSFTTAAVDTTPPTVTAQTPLPNATGVPANTTVTVTFSEAVDAATITLTSFQLKNGATVVPATVAYNPTTHIATLTPSSALASLTLYTASISGVKDLAGNALAAPVSWSFTTADTQAPTITAQTPAPNATSVPIATTVTVTFSEDMDATTITATTFQLKNGSTVVLADVVYSNRIATLTPRSALAGSTTYTATVTGAKDLAGNALAAASWSFTTVDTTAPTVTAQSPASGAANVSPSTSVSITFNEAVQWNLASFELRDAANALVPASVTYNATTRTATLAPSSSLANSATYTARVSGITDLAGNAMANPVTWSFTTAAPMAGTFSFWNASATPQTAADPDASAVELGVKFRSDAAGYITGIRFYKGSGNTGTHTGSLWSNTGTRLASVTFNNETATGWQTASFSTPVLISANTTYVASYFAPQGHYAVNERFFTNAGVDTAPLHALRSGVDGANGVYRYGATSGFPNSSYNGSNYWVDVIFAASLADTQAPSVISRTPLDGSSNVPTTSSVTATFNEAVQSATITTSTFVLRGPGGSTVPATVTYDAASKTATLAPTAPLTGGTNYTVTLSGVADLAGNVMVGSDTWSFTTVAVDTQPPTVTSQSPAPNATGIATGTTVRATFSEPIDPYSCSFTLQGPGGSVIPANVSYDDSSRTVTLTPTAALAASTSYTALLSGAKDLAGNIMSAASWSFTTASLVVPTVVAESPAPNDTNVPLNVPVTATFNEPVLSGSLVFALRDPSNNLIPTTFVYNSATQTASWTPSAPLASQTTYTATLSAATDAAGNTLSRPVIWSFTTLDATSPTIVNQSPLANATGVAVATSITVTFSEPVQSSTISLLLRDPANQLVAGNLAYNESTRTATFTPSTSLAAQATFTVSVSGVKDLAGNALVNPASWSFTTDGATGTGPYSLFSTTAIPAVAADSDASPVEVGVRFRSDLSGYITGVRFYKGTGNSGTHIGNLWSNTGTLLATATFGNESASGWQTVMFSSPVAITAGTLYVASYFAPSGHYAVSENGFADGLDNAPLHVPSDGAEGPNGIYRYGSRSGFPNSGYASSNYWVDVLFSTVYIDNMAPSVVANTPASGSANNALTTAVTAKFNESVQSSSISFVLRDPGNNIVPALVSYDDSTKTATLQPSSPLLANTAYTATVSGTRDLAGNQMSGATTWSFSTLDTAPPTIVSQTPAPGASGVTAKPVRIVFSEAMTASSITTTTFQLLDSTGKTVAASVSYNASTRTATLSATGSLTNGTTYTVRVVGGAAGVKDAAGNALTADVVWSFATA